MQLLIKMEDYCFIIVFNDFIYICMSVYICVCVCL